MRSRAWLGLSLVALLSGTGCFFNSAPPPGRGFAMSWKLVDASAPDTYAAPSLSCSAAGVSSVLLDLLDTSSGERHRVEFACAPLDGVTPELPEGSYQILAVARAGDGTALSQVKFDASNYDDTAADLGLTIFQIR